MRDHKAARRYARALFGLADADPAGKLDAADRDFTQVRALTDKHPEITRLVSNSTISLAQKEDLIDQIVPQGISSRLIHFLKVLIRKKRFADLGLIQEEFHRLYEKKKGIREVELVTAVELSPAVREKLNSVLKKRLKSEIRLHPKTDPDLIGGLILRFEGNEINGSLKSRLEELRQLLMA